MEGGGKIRKKNKKTRSELCLKLKGKGKGGGFIEEGGYWGGGISRRAGLLVKGVMDKGIEEV